MAQQPPPPPRPLPPRPSPQPAAAPAARRATAQLDPPPLDPSLIDGNGEIPPEPEDQNIHHGWMQQPWAQEILPFVSSLALHLVIILSGWLLYEGVKAASAPPLEEQIIIPEAATVDDFAGGVENPGIGGDPTRPAAQDKYEENTTPDGWAPEPGQSPVADTASEGALEGSDLIGGAGSFRGGNFTGTGTGQGGAGRLAPFGAPGGGMPGPRGKVFGNGGNARTIAFCCDSSGSMIDKFSSLKQELAKAIAGLKPIQQFSVVFFADAKAHTFEKGNLVNATPEMKRKAEKWLDDLTTSGTSDPIPGLEVAFKGKPDLMYILTDGDFPNNNEVLSKVTQLNQGRKTRINTIAFTTTMDDETSDSFVKFLETLADQNGGKYKKVSQDQLD